MKSRRDTRNGCSLLDELVFRRPYEQARKTGCSGIELCPATAPRPAGHQVRQHRLLRAWVEGRGRQPIEHRREQSLRCLAFGLQRGGEAGSLARGQRRGEVCPR